MTIYQNGRCPATREGARCRLKFGHEGVHRAYKEEIEWDRSTEERDESTTRAAREAGEHLR